jgi:filamentous hemagglutinin family protein
MNRLLLFFLVPSSCLAVSLPSAIQAQIVPDTTTNSTVTSDGNISEITSGTTAENNLFHSFEQFSVPTGGEVFFNNAPNIANIFSRVTGQSISNIDGLIRANGTANLFLLNPNGVIFGPNASLNIGGSFVVSTGNSIKFADGTEFSATNPQASPLLTVSVPIGLQYGSNARDIVVQGTGNNLSINFDTFFIERENRPVGLQVAPGQTLALVGGNISLEGGNLTAEEGRIELGSVGEGIVSLTPSNSGWTLSYENVSNFKDVNLSQAASVDTSGNGGGNIHLQGRRISLFDGSALLADTLGDGTGGTLTVRSSESVEVVGNAIANPFYGGMFTDVDPDATGNGGDLTIETARLLVADGTQISSGTFSSGNAGTLTVRAQVAEIIGGTPLGPSGLFTPVAPGVSGNGGNLLIETGRLLVADGAQIVVSNFGFGSSGNAGNLTIKATEVEVTGSNPGASSGLFANVGPGGTGNVESLTIETEKLRVTDGGLIQTGNDGSGAPGELTILATDVEITGFNEFNPSLVETTVGLDATGNGSRLNIETGRLLVADGAQISSGTNGPGDGGEINIRATEVQLIGAIELGRSGLFANAIIGTGEGGDINLTTDNLIVQDGATINVSNFVSLNPDIPPGQGAAGNINIEADSIVVGEGIITAETAAGDKGNILIQSQNVQLLENSTITTNAQGNASGGNIEIATNALVIKDNSAIAANASGLGSAGNISVRASDIDLERGNITATGNQGNLFLQSQNMQLRQESLISTNASGDNSGGNINITTGKLSILENSEISANASGEGSGGNVNIVAFSPTTLLLDRGKITATGGQGNITIESPLVLLRRGSQISTNGIGTAPGGNIIINTNFLIAVPQENSDITANAQQSFGGRVTIATQGLFGIAPQERLTPFSDITASSELGSEFSGVVQIVEPNVDPTSGTVNLPSEVVDATNQIVAGCPADEGNTFVVTGRGGLPENPGQTLQGRSLWQDLRDVAEERSQELGVRRHNSEFSRFPSQIVEAQGWVVGNDGKVQLVASTSEAISQGFWQQSVKCVRR